MSKELAGEGDNDAIEFDERVERSWIAYMKEFRDNVYPMFERFGLSFPEAFQIWETNRLKNMLQNLVDKND